MTPTSPELPADATMTLRERAQALRHLHDQVVHALQEVNVHAAVLQVVPRGRSEASVQVIASATRRALLDLGRMRGVLGQDEAPAYLPPPGLDALQDLLDAERPAHMTRVRGEDLPCVVPESVAAGAYRIAQEVLRALRDHDGLVLSDAGVRGDGGRLVLDLELGSEGDPPSPDLRRARIRAALLGGEVTLVPPAVDGASWIVRAALPLHPPA
jgi:signal transduction histidine kinase